MFLQVLGGLFGVFTGVEASAIDTENFYFEDYTGDYYLSRDDDGISHLRVVEDFTVIFPNYNQNKGICRDISFTNQNDTNVTLSGLDRTSLKLLRNGAVEPIYSIDKYDGYYEVCTGDDDYVLGKQVYTFEYEFEKVITDFGDFQELYWDTNGNGWTQRFDKVTARVHFLGDVANGYTGNNWCYVGAYGENGQDRCSVKMISGGVEFKAENLKSYENLTFDVELAPNTFVVPEIPENYTYIWLTLILAVICLLCMGLVTRKLIKSRDKTNYYKSIFVKPEYQPSVEYSLPEMAEIYLGKKEDMKVGMILELIVMRKIVLKKDGSKKWSILVKNLDGVGEEYIDLLSILNNGTRVKDGDEIKVKVYSASNRLMTLKRSIDSKILGDLKRDGLVEEKYSMGYSGRSGPVNMLVSVVIAVPVMIMMGMFILFSVEDILGLNNSYAGKMVLDGVHFYQIALIMITITTVVCVIINDRASKYIKHTLKGLEAVRYMEGLRLYIDMVEADRMRMLQSVEGADTSPTGIVKLYEKLLPYAAIFGLEDSWMKEMKRYCKVEEIEEPDYLMTGLAVSEMTRGIHNVARTAISSTTMSNSGGGSSSGFSGGGGGGFSGGGGGGGGGHGR